MGWSRSVGCSSRAERVSLKLRVFKRAGLVATIVLLQQISISAAAQPSTPGAPALAPTVDASSWAVHNNPANLVYTRGLSTGLVLRGFEDGAATPSASWVFGGSFADRFGGAFAIDNVRGTSPHTRISFGAGIGNSRFSMGFAARRWASPSRVGFRGYRTTDVFATFRFTRWLAATVGASNIFERRLDGVGTDRLYRIGIGLREPGGHVELDLSWASPLIAPEVNGRTTTRPRVSAYLLARLRPGASLWGAADLEIADNVRLATASAGIMVGLGPATIRAGTYAEYPGPTGEGWAGMLGFDIRAPEPASLIGDRNTLLRIQLGDAIPERVRAGLFGEPGMSHTDMLVLLDQVRREARIAGVFIDIGGLSSGGAQLQELRTALQAIRDAGMVVVMHLNDPTVRDLYLATVADFVTVSPNASSLEAGLSSSRIYLADLLARFGIEAQFVRIGDYKSGPERFTRTGPSDEANESLNAFLDDLWGELRRGMLDGSAVDGDALDAGLAQAPLFPAWLIDAGFVDATAHFEDVQTAVRTHFDRSFLYAWDYENAVGADEAWYPRSRIAILHIEGSIVTGRGGFDFLGGGFSTGSETIREACREIEATRSIDGVIVRINSPGGSATASDDMLRALRDLAEEVPVLVSMGNIAASGGYYVSALDTTVYASSTTLTGSIGIYAGTFAVDELLSRLGIARVFADRGGITGLFNGRAWDEERLAAVERSLQASYETFLGHVAVARNRTRDEIDAVAQGHIWSGRAALEADLVDDLGGFNAAWTAMRVEIGAGPRERVEVAHYPARGSLGALGLLRNFVTVDAAESDASIASVLSQMLDDSMLLRGVVALLEGHDGTLQARLEWQLEGL